MNSKRPASRRTDFGQRMLMARKHANLTQTAVRKLLSIPQSTIVDLESTATKSGYTARLANLYKVPALWLAEEAGPAPNWLNSHHASERLPLYPVAHGVSHTKSSDDLPEITWESLMGTVPESLFVLALRDDALAPQFSRGLHVVWSKLRRPQPGRLVLVRDKHGREHARCYHEGRLPGQWSAAAFNPAFASFDPQADGLVILAVQRGILDPPDAGEV